ncbi:hypothetical protein [Sporomusa termitida]|uniref:Uncharacterized protein n=1 Tax=Sporomusa termitida TaxID=2377 RepID=A0A517DY46_9FIRM|nr:hypothetical protein [Sporomusa termitida]QDR82277.1 hypothetical protein SPTER_37020 [Sporomusa termitida]
MRKPIIPTAAKISQYGIHPDLLTKRMAEYPEMTSVMVKELFPDAPEVIYPSAAGDGLDLIKKAAIAALQNVDMSMIKPGHSVNVLASHHGFTLLGGQPYATFLKVVRDEIESKTGATDIRLRAGNGLRFRETEEYIKQYGLNVHFKGKARCIAPIDEGIPIKTEIGTLYGLKSVYDADWIVHAHNSDVREVHFHRHVDRAVKPFGMSYARIETRSTYHQNLGPRGANFTARSIFESEFVKSKFAFTAFLDMAPSGVVGVVAANDLFELNDYLTFVGLNYYGKIMTLLGEIDECIVGLDFPCPVPYVFAAGVIYANMVGANVDLFDLDGDLPPYTWYTEAFYGKNGKPLIDDIAPVNPAVKMVIHNYAWGGYPSAFFSEQIPTIVVKKEQAELFDNDPQNLEYTKHAVISESLDNAMQFAYKTANTDKVLIFDGAIGGLNLSHSLLQLLQAKAPAVSKRVDEELMPKWLRQRGISPLGVKRQ